MSLFPTVSRLKKKKQTRTRAKQKKYTVSVIELKHIYLTLQDLINHFNNALINFQKHHFITNDQNKTLKSKNGI